MGEKRQPKNVQKLAADAAARSAEKPAKRQPTVAKKIRLRGGQPPKAKGKPNAVLKLITDALKRQEGR